jgi:sulfonate transport system substrate-binding protein
MDRLNRRGFIKSTFDVNKHIEPKHILSVMHKHPEPAPIPADAAIGPGYVFKP